MSRRSFALARAASILALFVACRDVTVPDTDRPLGSEVNARRKPPKPPPDTTPEPTPDPTPTPPPDGQPPTVPVFSIVEVGPTHIFLSWSSTDASNPILYRVEKNGALANYGFETSKTFPALQPSTTYTFTARARDAAGNWSQFSAPFTVTTTAPDPNDVTPPTAPTNFWVDLYGDGTREFQANWTRSTDNVTPQSAIVYHLYVNGVLENSSAGVPQTSGYGVAGENVFTVIAVDGAGNRSTAASFTLFIPF